MKLKLYLAMTVDMMTVTGKLISDERRYILSKRKSVVEKKKSIVDESVSEE